MAHLLGFELQRNNTRYNDNCQEAYIANAPGSSPSPNPLNLLALQLSCGLFPAAPPLVYSDKESAANAPQPPRIFQWIPHSPQRSPESKRAPPRNSRIGRTTLHTTLIFTRASKNSSTDSTTTPTPWG